MPLKDPYPENKRPNRIEDTEMGGERLAAKWFVSAEGLTIVTVLKERPYFCHGFEDRQGWLLK